MTQEWTPELVLKALEDEEVPNVHIVENTDEHVSEVKIGRDTFFWHHVNPDSGTTYAFFYPVVQNDREDCTPWLKMYDDCKVPWDQFPRQQLALFAESYFKACQIEYRNKILLGEDVPKKSYVSTQINVRLTGLRDLYYVARAKWVLRGR
jgi:hypothetical protein